MVRYTLRISQQMLQGFQSVSDHVGTFYMKGLIHYSNITEPILSQNCRQEVLELQ